MARRATRAARFAAGRISIPPISASGVGVAVRKDNALLRRALDFAFSRVAQQGAYAELYLKYFPVSFF